MERRQGNKVRLSLRQRDVDMKVNSYRQRVTDTRVIPYTKGSDREASDTRLWRSSLRLEVQTIQYLYYPSVCMDHGMAQNV